MHHRHPNGGVDAGPRHRPETRRGMILVVVLVCLAVVTLMFMAVARQAGFSRRTAQLSQRGLQAQWLAEAGVERAAARLAADPAYAGETWHIAAQDLGGRDEAEIRIEVAKTARPPGRSTIRVEADYPPAAELRCRRVKEIEVDEQLLKTGGPSPAASRGPNAAR